METKGVALGYVGDKIRYIVIIRVRFTAEFFCRTRIYRIDADASLGERVSQLYKIRYILIIRVRFTAEFFFEHGFIGLTRIKYQYIKIQKYIFLCFFLIFIY